MQDKLLKQFKNLQNVAPSSAWQETTRNFLLSEIKKSSLASGVYNNVEQSGNWSEKMFEFGYRLRSMLPSPAKAVSFMVLVGLIGGSAMAAQASVPSDKMYKFKKFYEKVEFLTATSVEDEASINLKHAGKRQEELGKLMEQSKAQGDQASEKIAKDIQEVTVALSQNVTAAEKTLSIVKEEKPGVAAELAKAVTETSQNAIEVLNKVSDTTNTDKTNNLEQTLTETKKELVKAEDKGLQVLVETVVAPVDNASAPAQTTSTDKVESKVVSPEELNQMLTKKIDRIDSEISAVKDKINDSIKTEIAAKIEIPKTAVEVAEAKVLIDKPVEAKKILEEAKNSLANGGSVVDALAKVQQTSLLVGQADLAVKAAEVKTAEKSAIQATSTTPNVVKPIEKTDTSTSTVDKILKSSLTEGLDGTTTLEEVILQKTDEFGRDLTSGTGDSLVFPQL